jgi:hypothetical protein
LLRHFLAMLGRLRGWAGGNRTRSIAIAATILLLIATTITGWAYLSSLAFRGGQFSSNCLEMLDQGRYEEARRWSQTRPQWSTAPHQYGGSLFVLGVIKTRRRERRRRNDGGSVPRRVTLPERGGFTASHRREIDGSFGLRRSTETT